MIRRSMIACVGLILVFLLFGGSCREKTSPITPTQNVSPSPDRPPPRPVEWSLTVWDIERNGLFNNAVKLGRPPLMISFEEQEELRNFERAKMFDTSANLGELRRLADLVIELADADGNIRVLENKLKADFPPDIFPISALPAYLGTSVPAPTVAVVETAWSWSLVDPQSGVSICELEMIDVNNALVQSGVRHISFQAQSWGLIFNMSFSPNARNRFNVARF
jgi:hypothetical protein